MAELLVIHTDDSGPYRRGDVVTVRPDGWTWGRMEDPQRRQQAVDGGSVSDSRAVRRDRFRIIRVPGLDWRDIRDWADPSTTTIETVPGESRQIPVNKSRIQIVVNNLPEPAQDALDRAGSTQISVGQLMRAARSKS